MSTNLLRFYYCIIKLQPLLKLTFYVNSAILLSLGDKIC